MLQVKSTNLWCVKCAALSETSCCKIGGQTGNVKSSWTTNFYMNCDCFWLYQQRCEVCIAPFSRNLGSSFLVVKMKDKLQQICEWQGHQFFSSNSTLLWMLQVKSTNLWCGTCSALCLAPRFPVAKLEDRLDSGTVKDSRSTNFYKNLVNVFGYNNTDLCEVCIAHSLEISETHIYKLVLKVKDKVE